MIPVTITCEAEPVDAVPSGPERFRPVLRVNGETVWAGAPVAGAEEAQRVALACLRYRLGGILGGADERHATGTQEAADDGEPVPLSASVDQLVEGLRREVADGMQRIQDFIDGGEWKRFLP